MSRFSELGKNKNAVMMKLLENDSIVKCLINNESNFLDAPIPDNFDRTSLIYSNIYPYKFIPETQDVAKTLITMKFGYKPNGVTIKNGSIYFYIIMHNSLLRTDYGSLRYDMLLSYIDETFNSPQDLELNDSFNSSRNLGFGQLPFYETDEFVVDKNWSGVYIAYKITDFR